MKRLLCITANMNAGGAETFLMKIYRNIDKSKYQMDFIVSYSGKNYYEEEIQKMGGRIFYVPPKSKNFIKSFFGVMKIVKDNNYQHVIRVNEHSLSTLDLLAAKIGGAKKLIMRSSNANSGSTFKVILHKIFRPLAIVIPNVKIAPSTDAAEYTFGKKQVKNNKVIILNNGLDIKQFTFDSKIRNKIRNELNINDKFVVGHIGRFNEQKNHLKLIEIFNELYKRNNKSILVLIGKGSLEKAIKMRVKELGIENSVLFLGEKDNINQLLFSFDILVFPSKYEGMPNVLIEAQTTGLKCIVSDSITQEANVIGLIKYISLTDSLDRWCNEILAIDNINRLNSASKMLKSGYDISVVAKKFEKIIFGGD